MAKFELEPSAVRSDRSANCATSTANCDPSAPFEMNIQMRALPSKMVSNSLAIFL